MSRRKLFAGCVAVAAVFPFAAVLTTPAGFTDRRAASEVPGDRTAATSQSDSNDGKSLSATKNADRKPRHHIGPRGALLRQALSGFEENRGQAAPGVKFLWRSASATVFLSGNEAVVSLRKSAAQGSASVLRMKLQGASRNPRIEGGRPTGEVSNYYRGNDPAKWVTRVPKYRRVVMRNVYPGIDMVWHENKGSLEYDFVLSPRADPGVIALELEGKGRAFVDGEGGLVWRAGEATVRQDPPVIYQNTSRGRRAVRGGYVKDKGNAVRFRLAQYDRDQPLIIDPVLSFSTLVGGGGEDAGLALTLDSQRNIYVAGRTNSTDLPQAVAARTGSDYDAFVVKMSPGGSSVIFSSYIGGEDPAIADEPPDEAAHAIAMGIDDSSLYLAGETQSDDFPVLACRGCRPCDECTGGAGRDAFIAKLGPLGTLDRSVLYGGEGHERAFEVAVGPEGSVKITGETGDYDDPSKPPSSNLPTTKGGDQVCGSSPSSCIGADVPSDGFLAAFNSDLSGLTYGSYLGGDSNDEGIAIAVDPSSGATYVYAMVNPPTPGVNVGPGMLIKFGSDGATDWSRSVDGAEMASLQDVRMTDVLVLDPDGNVYLTGTTRGLGPSLTGNGFQPQPAAGKKSAFLLKLSSAGTPEPLYLTYLGGTGVTGDAGTSVSAGAAGRVLVTGYTTTEGFPTKFPLQPNHSNPCTGPVSLECTDAFAAFIDTNTSGEKSLMYSTYLGGAGIEEAATAAAMDSSGNGYVAGYVRSALNPAPQTFPVTPSAYQKQLKGNWDAFVTKILPLTITGLEPVSGLTCGGDQVKIKGFGLAEATAVKFGDVQVPPDSVSYKEVAATTPPSGPGPVRISIVTPDVPETPDPVRELTSQGAAASVFTYLPATAPCVSAPPPPPGPGPGPAPGPDPLPKPGPDPNLNNIRPPGTTAPPVAPGGGPGPTGLLASQNAASMPPPAATGRPPVLVPGTIAAPGTAPVQAPAPFAGAATSAGQVPSPLVAGTSAERPEEPPVVAPQFYSVGKDLDPIVSAFRAGAMLLGCTIVAAGGGGLHAGVRRSRNEWLPAPRCAA